MLTVLLVEDDRLVSSVLVSYFNSIGIVVHHVTSIAEANEALKLPFVCIISDYILEDGTAHDIDAPAIPLVVISGFSPTHTDDQSVQAWIEKPFDLGTLERLVRKSSTQSA